jgi:hypothetical protein
MKTGANTEVNIGNFENLFIIFFVFARRPNTKIFMDSTIFHAVVIPSEVEGSIMKLTGVHLHHETCISSYAKKLVLQYLDCFLNAL